MEKPDHDLAREEARAILDRLDLKPVISYRGKRKEGTWEFDEWDVALGTYRTTYKTGLGHRIYARRNEMRRVLPFGTRPAVYTEKEMGPVRSVHRANFDRDLKRPVFPDPVNVVCSLVRDGEAVDMSFVDWCNDFGMNSDSIKDRATYDACCDIGQRLREQIKRDDLEKLRDCARRL